MDVHYDIMAQSHQAKVNAIALSMIYFLLFVHRNPLRMPMVYPLACAPRGPEPAANNTKSSAPGANLRVICHLDGPRELG